MARLLDDQHSETDTITVAPDTPLEELAFSRFIEDHLNHITPPTLLQAGWLPEAICKQFATLSMGVDGVYAEIKPEDAIDLWRVLEQLGYAIHDAQPLWSAIIAGLERIAERFARFHT